MNAEKGELSLLGLTLEARGSSLEVTVVHS